MDSEATPTPWEASPPDGSYHDVIRIYSTANDRVPVAVCPQMDSPVMAMFKGETNDTTQAAANSALIVRAVNAHDDLVEALGGAADDLADRLESARARGHDTIHINARVVETMVAEFRAALAKAGER